MFFSYLFMHKTVQDVFAIIETRHKINIDVGKCRKNDEITVLGNKVESDRNKNTIIN